MSKQFQEQFRFAVAPANFGLCDRSGTDALVHLLRAASDADPDLAITCVDGVGAFDHVHRARIFEELLAHPVLRDLVPHVRMWYGTRSTFVWTDESGESHLVEQAEGGEQGDPLMPALFCLAVRPALQAAQGMLQSGEGVFAYLDDVYLLTRPERARDALDTVSRNLGESCGIAVNQGKLQSWSRSGGEAPAVSAALDTADNRVWRGSELPERNGVTIVGTPIGHTAFVDRTADEKLAEQGALATEVLRMPSTQSTWLLFLFCVVPRINHLLRTVPPAQAAGLASRHDDRIFRSFCDIIGVGPDTDTRDTHGIAKELWERQARLPLHMGGCGLRSSTRTSAAAYWASVADSLPVLSSRCPEFTARVVADLESNQAEDAGTLVGGARAALSSCTAAASPGGPAGTPCAPPPRGRRPTRAPRRTKTVRGGSAVPAELSKRRSARTSWSRSLAGLQPALSPAGPASGLARVLTPPRG